MRILLSWLRDFVDVPVGPADLADTLAMRGFEVAAVDPPPPGINDSQEDAVLDLEITANRPDCLGIMGIAREVCAAYTLPLRAPALRHDLPAAPEAGARLDVELEDADLCPRYSACVATVQVGASPAWLATRLIAAGVRPINNIVDVTNYVMVELGQPMHAFDLARLGGATLRIRRARAGETISTLDGFHRVLGDDMLVIADADRAQAIAGVMGGLDAEVHHGTSWVAFESATFKPASVRRTSKRLGLSTEASHRFERGADIAIPVVALQRACALLERLGSGRPAGPVIDRYPEPRSPARLPLRRDRIVRVLGTTVQDTEARRILEHLGFGVRIAEGGTAGVADWEVVVPTARVDVTREVDLIEELARHHGYDRVPATFPALREMPPPADSRIERDELVRRVLIAAGFSEATTFAFIERGAATLMADEPSLVGIANPLSESFAVLRPYLAPGLIDAVSHNRRREQRDILLFEIGVRFQAGRGERRGVAMARTGHTAPEHWSGTPRTADFYDMKGVLEALCAAFDVTPEFVAADRQALVPGRTAAVRALRDGGPPIELGFLGQLTPEVVDARGLPRTEEVFVAELDLESLAPRGVPGASAVAPLPRHPSIVRDLSIIVDETLPAAAVRGTIRSAAPDTLVSVREFARYQGKGVPDGRVSLSWRLTFRASDRTLTDAEVHQATTAILDALTRTHNAVLR